MLGALLVYDFSAAEMSYKNCLQYLHLYAAIYSGPLAEFQAYMQMNLRFPFPELPEDQFSICLSDFSPEQLRSADVSSFQYPLFIRLETLADKAAPGGHELSERVAGAPLTSWIQCQTTCAVFGEPENTDEDSCKIVRQRIWVHDLFYDLQVCSLVMCCSRT